MIVYPQAPDPADAQQKLQQLYERYKYFIYGTAFRILRSRDDAEDAVHDAFLRLFRNLERIGPVDSPRTRSFIAILSEHCAIDILRKNRHYAPFPADPEILAAAEPPPDENPLGELILRLKPQLREVLFLRYYDGYSEKEIALLLGISYSYARQLIRRARKALEAELRRSEDTCGKHD